MLIKNLGVGHNGGAYFSISLVAPLSSVRVKYFGMMSLNGIYVDGPAEQHIKVTPEIHPVPLPDGRETVVCGSNMMLDLR